MDKPGTAGSLLRRYFYSGWAFLLPYLLFYVLYYWRKWPVNPPSSPGPSHWGRIPALLHVYWALHALHLLTGAFSLRSFWHEQPLQSKRSWADLLQPVIPWALLALLFCLPGTYLEFPSDPWDHFARINSCADHQTPILYKYSGYFLAYSLIGRVPADRQLLWLNVYYTGTCLLLCWQYFRLARAIGLEKPAAFLFVLLQVVLFGNSAFSFYRYYGLASTMFSQLGAVALIRLGLEAVARRQSQAAPLSFSPFPPRGLNSVLFPLFTALFLVALIAFNHIQGLGIAALGLAAVGVWRLIVWKTSMIWWLLAATLILGMATVHWWPRHPAIDHLYRPQGWLTAWYGFNVWSSHSPAGDRALQILGLFGVANFVAGLLLLRYNHVAGWLTVMPVLALCLPFVAIPLANALVQKGDPQNIIVFHRMLLAIPSGLALVCLGQKLLGRKAPVSSFQWQAQNNPFMAQERPSLFAFPVLLLCLAGLMVVPAGGPFFNRAWHAFVRPPDDLSMHAPRIGFDEHRRSPNYSRNTLFAATSGLSYVMNTGQPTRTLFADYRIYLRDGRSPAIDLGAITNALSQLAADDHATVVVPQPTLLYTPYSFAALCSTHWFPQEVALDFSGAKELQATSTNLGLRSAKMAHQIIFYQKK